MEVKKAIETLKDYIKCASDNWSVTISDTNAVEFNDIIDLLQQGEKYRLILKELDKKYGHYLIGVKDNGKIGEGYTIRDLIDISYQKYFPKNKETNDKG